MVVVESVGAGVVVESVGAMVVVVVVVTVVESVGAIVVVESCENDEDIKMHSIKKLKKLIEAIVFIETDIFFEN